jgi:hypothetical protein
LPTAKAAPDNANPPLAIKLELRNRAAFKLPVHPGRDPNAGG